MSAVRLEPITRRPTPSTVGTPPRREHSKTTPSHLLSNLSEAKMLTIAWKLAATIYWLFQRSPSNRILGWLRRRDNLRWGIIAFVPATIYLFVGITATHIAAEGGPQWLHLVFIIGAYNALKFTAWVPWSIVLFMNTRFRESSGKMTRVAARASEMVDSED